MHVPEMFSDHRMFMFLYSVIGKHFRDLHGLTPDDLIKNFKAIKKCCGKFECLIYENCYGLKTKDRN